jgi:hypothetical protein
MTEEEIRKQVIIDWSMTFGTEHGKRVLADLSEICNENRSSYQIGDAYHTTYLVDMRTMMIEVRRMLNRNPNNELELNTRND